VSKKLEKFDRLLWLRKQIHLSRVKEYLLPPCLLLFKDPDIFEFLQVFRNGLLMCNYGIDHKRDLAVGLDNKILITATFSGAGLLA